MPRFALPTAPRRPLVMALWLCLSLSAGAQAADPALTWDLTPIYASDNAWDAARQAALAELPALSALRGTLGRDAASLRTALDRISAANQRMERLWVYAYALQSTDNR
ncbi:MAG: hypothetical protein ACK5W4_02455, partial [Inhella sp.]